MVDWQTNVICRILSFGIGTILWWHAAQYNPLVACCSVQAFGSLLLSTILWWLAVQYKPLVACCSVQSFGGMLLSTILW